MAAENVLFPIDINLPNSTKFLSIWQDISVKQYSINTSVTFFDKNIHRLLFYRYDPNSWFQVIMAPSSFLSERNRPMTSHITCPRHAMHVPNINEIYIGSGPCIINSHPDLYLQILGRGDTALSSPLNSGQNAHIMSYRNNNTYINHTKIHISPH
jgi:hypothetical protein